MAANENGVADGARSHVGDNLHVAVGMGWKPGVRTNGVVVPHPERPQTHTFGIAVVGEAEMIVGVEPVVLESPQIIERHNGDHLM